MFAQDRADIDVRPAPGSEAIIGCKFHDFGRPGTLATIVTVDYLDFG